MSPTILEHATGLASSPPPDASRPRTPHRRHPQRLPLTPGLALSALIHLLALVIWPHFVGSGPPAARVSPEAVAAAEWMRVVAIAPATGQAPPIVEQVERPEPEPEPEPSERAPSERAPLAPRTGEPATGEPATGVASSATSAADRLAPSSGDLRLWAVPEAFTTPEASDIERARAHAYGRVEQISDSVLMAQEATLRLLDWTHTGDEGRRWGISPDGKIHLGGLLGRRKPSVEFAGSPEMAERLREWNAMSAQADLARVRDLLSERVKAIRERKDRERVKKDGGSN